MASGAGSTDSMTRWLPPTLSLPIASLTVYPPTARHGVFALAFAEACVAGSLISAGLWARPSMSLAADKVES
jgi:hypothetical protein